jgi:hypothetical protein
MKRSITLIFSITVLLAAGLFTAVHAELSELQQKQNGAAYYVTVQHSPENVTAGQLVTFTIQIKAFDPSRPVSGQRVRLQTRIAVIGIAMDYRFYAKSVTNEQGIAAITYRPPYGGNYEAVAHVGNTDHYQDGGAGGTVLRVTGQAPPDIPFIPAPVILGFFSLIVLVILLLIEHKRSSAAQSSKKSSKKQSPRKTNK